MNANLAWWLAGGAVALLLGLRQLPDDFDARSGRLIDSVTGAPVAGATVVASWSGFIDVFGNQRPVLHAEVAVTDAEGRWRLPGWPAGRGTDFREVRVNRWAAVPGRPAIGVPVGLVSSTSPLQPVAQGDGPRAEALYDAFMQSRVFGSEARDGSGAALLPLQLALIAEIERLAPTPKNLDMLTWAREGLAVTQNSARAKGAS